jgi:arylsulfatase A-like enzyme
MRRRGASGVIGVLLCVVVSACGGGSPPPNVVLVTVDTLRADRLNPYGYRASATPNVERLARDGIVFDRAFCEATWTIPSIASVMTALYPFEHGVEAVGSRLDESETTLAEVLAAHGYHTSGIVASFPLDRQFGFAQGFDEYDDTTDRPLAHGPTAPSLADDAMFHQDFWAWYGARLTGNAYRTDAAVADRARAWLATAPREPFFLWVHFFGPHDKPRDDGLPRGITDEAYDHDVASFDREFGRLLDAIEAGPGGARTAVLLHSDHGETIDEHVPKGHGFDVYDSTGHVPLVIRLPGRARAGERVHQLVTNLDVLPTVLGLARVPVPPGLHGHDLLRAHAPDDGPVHLSTRLAPAHAVPQVEVDGRVLPIGPSLRGLRTGRWKLVVWEPVIVPSPEMPDAGVLPASYVAANRAITLFDLRVDPTEQHDVAAAHPEQVRRLFAALSWIETHGRPRRAAAVQPLPAGARERLRALGYIE